METVKMETPISLLWKHMNGCVSFDFCNSSWSVIHIEYMQSIGTLVDLEDVQEKFIEMKKKYDLIQALKYYSIDFDPTTCRFYSEEIGWELTEKKFLVYNMLDQVFSKIYKEINVGNLSLHKKKRKSLCTSISGSCLSTCRSRDKQITFDTLKEQTFDMSDKEDASFSVDIGHQSIDLVFKEHQEKALDHLYMLREIAMSEEKQLRFAYSLEISNAHKKATNFGMELVDVESKMGTMGIDYKADISYLEEAAEKWDHEREVCLVALHADIYKEMMSMQKEIN